MTSKERVLTTFARQQPDRVPINYLCNEGIDHRLKKHFGLSDDDDEGLRQALGVDFRAVDAEYIGPKLHQDIPERGVIVTEWGIHRRWVEHETGGYWDFCDFPLANASEEEVAEWPLPSPDDFDYNQVLEKSKRYKQYAVFVGNPGIADIINQGGMLRGTEQTLIDLITDDPAGMLLAKRRVEIQLEILQRSFEAAKGGVDFLWMGEDLGAQNGPLISIELFRKQLRPLHQRFVDLAKSYNLPVMIHSCGSSSWAFRDFIEMGMDVVDTLQPEAKDMAPEYLKKSFGESLAFHGCISTAGPVVTGNPDDVIRYCRRTLEIMMPGGGYAFVPTHRLQDNTPTENALAMYQTAREFGVY